MKVNWYESLLLIVAIVALFRPGFIMDQLYPEFRTVDLQKFVAGDAVAPAGYTIRFHVVRSTDYGDRFKLFRVETPKLAGTDNLERYGVALKRQEDGRYQVSELRPKGLAEQAGLQLDDYVVGVDVQQGGQPRKEWIYPFGLAVLAIVVGTQYRRWRRQRPRAVAAGAAS